MASGFIGGWALDKNENYVAFLKACGESLQIIKVNFLKYNVYAFSIHHKLKVK